MFELWYSISPSDFSTCHGSNTQELPGMNNFLDDTYVCRKDDKELLSHLRAVFQHLREKVMKLGLSKCIFQFSIGWHLGNIVDGDSLHMIKTSIKLKLFKKLQLQKRSATYSQFLDLSITIWSLQKTFHHFAHCYTNYHKTKWNGSEQKNSNKCSKIQGSDVITPCGVPLWCWIAAWFSSWCISIEC